MSSGPEWFWWIVAAVVAALFIGYFAYVGRTLLGHVRSVVTTIQDWPQIRRSMVEAEVRAGGRYPVWFRAIRVTLVLAMVGLIVWLVFRKLTT